eukprot:Partr_v1_DN25137_c0_g1_i4_m76565 putative zinc finger
MPESATNPLVQNCLRLGAAIPVAFVSALLIWVYYCYVFLFLPSPALSDRVGVAVVLGILFNIVFALQAVSFFKVVATNPGRVPAYLLTSPTRLQESSGVLQTGAVSSHELPLINNSGNASDNDDLYSTNQLAMITSKRDGTPRVCRKCNGAPKPDRSHHCSICGTCVLKQDHHCPWINNCVGFYNQKFFLLFLLYSALLGFYVLFSIIGVLLNSDMGVSLLQVVILAMVGAVFGLSLAGFTIMHVTMVCANKTTIESWERHRYVNTGNISRRQYVNIFDLGAMDNWTQVMGPVPVLWFIPICNRY